MMIRQTEIRPAPLHFEYFSLTINWLDLHSDAKFVLVVEKEASFQRLMDDNVLQRLHPCIIITVSTSLASSTGCFFDWVSLNQNRSNHNTQSDERKISRGTNKNPEEKNKSQLPKARENAGDQVAIGFSFASDWLRKRRTFSKPADHSAKKG